MYFGYNLTNLRSFYNFLLFCKKKMQKENKIKQLKETKKKKKIGERNIKRKKNETKINIEVLTYLTMV